MTPIDALEAERAHVRRPVRWSAVVLLGVTVAALAVTALRLRNGVDLGDESFYVVFPWRVVLGARPFIDDLDLHQTAGLLTVPLVWIWLHLRGSTTSLIPFMRVMWFTFVCTVAFSGYSFMSRFMPRALAFAASTLFVIAIPFGIPTLSYNTLGAGLLTMGLALLAMDAVDGSTHWFRTLPAAVALVIAAFAYPPLVVAACVAAVCFAIASVRKGRLGAALTFGVAFLGLLGIIGCLMLVYVGPQQLLTVWRFSSGPGRDIGDIQRVLLMGKQGARLAGVSLIAQALLLAVAVGLSGKHPNSRLAILFLPLLAVLTVNHFFEGHVLYWTTSFGLFSLVLLVYEPAGSGLRRAAVVIAPAAIVAGGLTAVASTNLFMNAGLGLTPLLLLAFPLVYRTAMPSGSAWETNPLVMWTETVAFGALVVVVAAISWSAIYADGQPPTLTAVVDSGPWRGMRTRPEVVRFMESVSKNLTGRRSADGRLLVYPGYPGVYLLSGLRPDAPASYLGDGTTLEINDPGLHEVVKKFYQSHPQPEVIVHVGPPENGRLDATVRTLSLRDTYRWVLTTPTYQIAEMVRSPGSP